MAQRVITELIDDIDGSEATGTVEFAIDGTRYAIDLNDGHAEDLREVLAPFVSVARKASGGPVKQRVRNRTRQAHGAPAAPAVKADPKAIRAWAKENGIEISGRGRISEELRAKYTAALGD